MAKVAIGGCEIEPPKGFFCSRDFGHSGPCSTHPLADLMEEPVRQFDRVPCPVNFGGLPARDIPEPRAAEKSGGPVSYYLVDVVRPNQGKMPYQAECSDIIESLGMNFNEGEAFKALWRKAAARTLGKLKDGGSAKYDAEKVAHYGKRLLAMFEPPLVDSNVDKTMEVPFGLVLNRDFTLQEAQDVMQHFVDNVPGFRHLMTGTK
jgi:hypothetical protein